jgi:hypothetical protein
MRITHGLKYPAALVASAGLLAGGYGVAVAISPSDSLAAAPASSAASAQNAPQILAIETVPQPGLTVEPDQAGQVPALPAQPGDGSSPQKRGGLGENLSIGMRPQSAAIVSVNLDDSDSEFVEFRFADRVQEIRNPQAFILQDYAGEAAVAATSARLVQGRGGADSVLAGFPSGTDLRSYTLAVVENGAVANRDGDSNVQASVRLAGSQTPTGPGRTAGPDLVAVSHDETLNRITYRFDEQIDGGAGLNPTGFGFYTQDGARHEGSSIVTSEDNWVTIQFDEAAGAQVENALSEFVGAQAVEDLKGSANPIGAMAGLTSLPELVSTTPVAGMPTQLDFRFNRVVSHGDLGAFAAYSEVGTPYRGVSLSRPSAQVVRVTFPAIRDFSNQIVMGAVASGAVRALDTAGEENSIATAPVRSSHVAWGATSGPNLVASKLDRATGEVTFTFDKKLDDDIAVDPSAFSIITVSNRLEPGSALLLVHGKRAIVQFAENAVAGAEGITIDAGAVADYQGHPNPVSTTGITSTHTPTSGARAGSGL